MAPARPPLRDLVAAVAPTTACVLPSFLAGTTAVQMRADLGFDAAQLGLLFGAFFGAGALGSAVLGRMAEGIGAGRSLRLASLLAGLTMLAVATVGRSFTLVLALLAVGGLANALAQPSANLWLARAISAESHGMAFGVKQSAIPAAMLIGGLAVPAVSVPLGWRWAFVVGAGLAAAAASTVPRREPHLETRPDDGPPLLHTRPLLVLAGGIGLGAAAAGTVGSFMVSAVVDAGIGEGAAGLLFAVGSALGLTTRLVLGVRADRHPGGQLRQVAVMMAGGSVAYLLFATGEPAVMVAATPIAFVVGWGWPGLFNLSIVRHHPRTAGAATGITQTGTYLGAVIGPVAFGAAVEAWGYGPSWTLVAATTVTAGATTYLGRRLLKRAVAVATPIPA